MLSVEVQGGAGAVAAVAEDWRRLAAACMRPRFFHWLGWWKACLLHLEPDPAAVSFFVVRRGAEPVAILPLKRLGDAVPLPGARVWGLPRHPHLPLSGFPCRAGLDPAELLSALCDAVRDHDGAPCDALWFEPLLAESPLARLKGAGRGLHRAVIKTCDEVPCCAPGEDHRQRLSANFRSNLNKARNKLGREAHVEYATITRPEALADALAGFEELEASGWKGAAGAGTAIRLHAPLRAFYRALVAELAPEGRIVIHALRAAGRPIAGQFCLRDADTLYVLKLAYDEDFSRLAPGNMLLEHVLQSARSDAGIERVNLVGNPPWFRDWRPEQQDVLRLCVANTTLRGRTLAGLLGLKRRLLPAWRSLRAPLSRIRRPARVRTAAR
jgi:CelD/BcsL family acetyltransferase involved in cellulose biosynthesis